MKKTMGILLSLFMVSAPAFATTSVSKTIDSLKATGGNSLAVPSVGTAFATDTNSITVTGKTMSGASNTFSALPVATQYQQDTFTPNGSTTTFTLSNSVPAASGLVVHLDGRALIQGSGFDYTVSGTTLTMNTAPATGQKLLVVYSKF